MNNLFWTRCWRTYRAKLLNICWTSCQKKLLKKLLNKLLKKLYNKLSTMLLINLMNKMLNKLLKKLIYNLRKKLLNQQLLNNSLWTFRTAAEQAAEEAATFFPVFLNQRLLMLPNKGSSIHFHPFIFSIPPLLYNNWPFCGFSKEKFWRHILLQSILHRPLPEYHPLPPPQDSSLTGLVLSFHLCWHINPWGLPGHGTKMLLMTNLL